MKLLKRDFKISDMIIGIYGFWALILIGYSGYEFGIWLKDIFA